MSKPPTLTHAVTLEVRDHCLCLHSQRVARALGRRFDAAFRPHGLTNGQFSLLMALNRPEPPTVNAVAALLAMDRTTLTAALKPLTRRGLVEIETDPADRRARRPLLTASGRALLGRAVETWRTEHEKLERALTGPATGSGEGLRSLSALLQPASLGKRAPGALSP